MGRGKQHRRWPACSGRPVPAVDFVLTREPSNSCGRLAASPSPSPRTPLRYSFRRPGRMCRHSAICDPRDDHFSLDALPSPLSRKYIIIFSLFLLVSRVRSFLRVM
ncbi:hypothetical protein BV25DRAFT_225179 [Artomyces pyxidatus]|uniref:Uncharacterized protein n=1 Tax=Artomyces pyxidatus TaxID=48021 RepID=A0ACB8TA19_9AGAM|nr:hypothetical protein BV25DRAFT_225179 [Artomyces pyxidatus]